MHRNVMIYHLTTQYYQYFCFGPALILKYQSIFVYQSNHNETVTDVCLYNKNVTDVCLYNKTVTDVCLYNKTMTDVCLYLQY